MPIVIRFSASDGILPSKYINIWQSSTFLLSTSTTGQIPYTSITFR